MLATLVALTMGLAVSLAVGLALTAHHVVLARRSGIVAAGILAVLSRIATITTSVGHFIFRRAIFFTRVGKNLIFSRLKEVPNRSPYFLDPFYHQQNALGFRRRQAVY